MTDRDEFNERAGYWRELLRPVHAGRRWLIVVDILAATTGAAAYFAEQGALRSFVIAGSPGTGDPPAEEHADYVVLGTSGDSILDGIRNFERAVADLPAAVLARIDEWDPDVTARAINPFLPAGVTVAGRRLYGSRPRAWADVLENKVEVDAVWDGAGIARAPSEVVAAMPEALQSAAARLDAGSGTVWAGDQREGWNGGAEYVRRVQHRDTVAEAVAFFTAHCDRVRVMPFLDGIPCSIHGIVFPDRTIALRPMEMVTLRVPDTARFLYAGVSTFWDPGPADTAAMRDVARRVGEHVRAAYDYRGGFTVDGVMTAAGFLPTEFNARVGAGIGALLQGLEIPVGGLNRALIAGEDLDYRSQEFEDLVMTWSEQNRGGGGHLVVAKQVDETMEQPFVFDGDSMRAAEADETPDGKLMLGPGAMGGFLAVRPEPERMPVGPPAAPRTVAALALADELWEIGIGPVEAAAPAR